MPVNKDALKRYRIIDRLLSDPNRDYTTEHILREVNKECDSVSIRMIQKDIKSLEEEFFKNKSGTIKNVESKNDGIVIEFCYIYDINFDCTYEIIKENNYYEKIYERINRKDIFKKYLDYANKYIQERIDKNAT
jgi:hypothetical protein